MKTYAEIKRENEIMRYELKKRELEIEKYTKIITIYDDYLQELYKEYGIKKRDIS